MSISHYIWNNYKCSNIIDGGSGINLVPDFTLKLLGLQLSGEAKFTITLADGSRVKPLGIVEKVPVEMDGPTFSLDFVVLNLSQVNGGFPLLIGRPWLRHIQAMHDWGNDTILVNLPRQVQKQVHLDPKGSHGGNTHSFTILEEQHIPIAEACNEIEINNDQDLLEWMEACPCYGISICEGEFEHVETLGLGEPVMDLRRGKKGVSKDLAQLGFQKGLGSAQSSSEGEDSLTLIARDSLPLASLKEIFTEDELHTMHLSEIAKVSLTKHIATDEVIDFFESFPHFTGGTLTKKMLNKVVGMKESERLILGRSYSGVEASKVCEECVKLFTANDLSKRYYHLLCACMYFILLRRIESKFPFGNMAKCDALLCLSWVHPYPFHHLIWTSIMEKKEKTYGTGTEGCKEFSCTLSNNNLVAKEFTFEAYGNPKEFGSTPTLHETKSIQSFEKET
ncbi:hypothetical protein KP509_02G054000 [Ceratopteris richardii]|uniref:Uncharacterized protein n=1 Tax=Ceratopteris richardii TaxID=49495 RepID=A0A8T2VE46_CERRI|nr:hypothetical protein KP509_02G054000 [Ceratopteris richardii]